MAGFYETDVNYLQQQAQTAAVNEANRGGGGDDFMNRLEPGTTFIRLMPAFNERGALHVFSAKHRNMPLPNGKKRQLRCLKTELPTWAAQNQYECPICSLLSSAEAGGGNVGNYNISKKMLVNALIYVPSPVGLVLTDANGQQRPYGAFALKRLKPYILSLPITPYDIMIEPMGNPGGEVYVNPQKGTIWAINRSGSGKDTRYKSEVQISIQDQSGQVFVFHGPIRNVPLVTHAHNGQYYAVPQDPNDPAPNLANHAPNEEVIQQIAQLNNDLDKVHPQVPTGEMIQEIAASAELLKNMFISQGVRIGQPAFINNSAAANVNAFGAAPSNIGQPDPSAFNQAGATPLQNQGQTQNTIPAAVTPPQNPGMQQNAGLPQAETNIQQPSQPQMQGQQTQQPGPAPLPQGSAAANMATFQQPTSPAQLVGQATGQATPPQNQGQVASPPQPDTNVPAEQVVTPQNQGQVVTPQNQGVVAADSQAPVTAPPQNQGQVVTPQNQGTPLPSTDNTQGQAPANPNNTPAAVASQSGQEAVAQPEKPVTPTFEKNENGELLCPYCSKPYKTERFLKKHIADKHAEADKAKNSSVDLSNREKAPNGQVQPDCYRSYGSKDKEMCASCPVEVFCQMESQGGGTANG